MHGRIFSAYFVRLLSSFGEHAAEFERLMDNLPELFSRKTAAFRAAADRRFSALELNTAQVALLSLLWDANDRTPAELARDLGVTAPTVSKMLKSMTSRGFIGLAPCPFDSRSVRVRLTRKGSAIRAAVEELWRAIGSSAFGGFTETERLMLGQLLAKMSWERDREPKQTWIAEGPAK